MADSIGMMNNAYFVSRSEVLNWINDTLEVLFPFPKLNLTP
jgi:hypothetical protein